jgi:molybdenum-dependent DNA-binding transcriptional regulator ModE
MASNSQDAFRESHRAGDNFNRDAAQVGHGLQSMAHDAWGWASSGVAGLGRSASESVDSARQAVSRGYHNAEQGAIHMAHDIYQSNRDIIDPASQLAGAVGHRAVSAANGVAHAAHEQWNAAGQSLNAEGRQIASSYHQAHQAVDGALHQAGQAVDRTAHQAGQAYDRTVHQASAALNAEGRQIASSYHQAHQTVDRSMHEAGQAVDRRVHQAGAALSAEGHQIASSYHQAHQAVDRTVHQAGEAIDRTGRQISESVTRSEQEFYRQNRDVIDPLNSLNRAVGRRVAGAGHAIAQGARDAAHHLPALDIVGT